MVFLHHFFGRVRYPFDQAKILDGMILQASANLGSLRSKHLGTLRCANVSGGFVAWKFQTVDSESYLVE